MSGEHTNNSIAPDARIFKNVRLADCEIGAGANVVGGYSLATAPWSRRAVLL